MNRNASGFIQYLRLLRVLDWVHLLGVTVLGYTYASRSAVFSKDFWLGIIVASLYLAHGYSINECFDNRIGRNVEISGKYFSHFNNAIFISVLIFIANFAFTFAYSPQLVPLVAFGGIISFLYSGPFRLKEVPFIGLIVNSLCFTPLFLIGYLSVGPFDLNAILMSVFIFIFFLPVDLIHQLNDADIDRARDSRTTVIVYRVKKTLVLIVVNLLILNSWAMILFWYMKIPYLSFLLTLFFSACMLVYLLNRFNKYGSDVSKYKIKIRLRYLLILYGIGLIGCFLSAG